MYTQQQAAILTQKFWISFGKYMSPIPSVGGEKVTWINYRTGIKFIHFKMTADTEQAKIGIELSHKDPAEQELYFNHFKTFKKAFEEIMEERWLWEQPQADGRGNNITSISIELPDVNLYNENDWPKIISFLKERLIKLDKFWIEYRDIFDMLT